MAGLEKLRLAQLTWDSDTDPDGFFIHLGNFSNVCNSLTHGSLLEDMLDSKLRRKRAGRTVPSFLLEDPDFAAAPAPETTLGARRPTRSEAASSGETGTAEPAASQASGGSGGSGHFSLGSHHTKYADLPQEARDLDGMLYNIFKMSVKGSKQSLLESVTFPSYVQAVLILVKHMAISRMGRIMAAFKTIDGLSYQGDTLKFQTEFLIAKRELDNCDVTIEDYLMCRLMRAFDGKSRTIQHKIAMDFNEQPASNINFYDLVQGYMAELASVGEGKPHRVGMAYCPDCGTDGHESQDCPKRKARDVNRKNKEKNDRIKAERLKKSSKSHEKLTCHNCGELGHIKPNCPHPLGGGKPAASINVAEVKETAVPTLPPPAYPPPDHVALVPNTGPLSVSELQQLVSQLRSSSRTLMVQESYHELYDDLPSNDVVSVSPEVTHWTTWDSGGAYKREYGLFARSQPSFNYKTTDRCERRVDDPPYTSQAEKIYTTRIGPLSIQLEKEKHALGYQNPKRPLGGDWGAEFRSGQQDPEQIKKAPAEFSRIQREEQYAGQVKKALSSAELQKIIADIRGASSVLMARVVVPAVSEEAGVDFFDCETFDSAVEDDETFHDCADFPTGPRCVQQEAEQSEKALSAAELQKIIAGKASVLMAKPTGELARSAVPAASEQDTSMDFYDCESFDESIHLSLCTGMGADVYALRQVGAEFTRTIGVEKCRIKQALCHNLNPPELVANGGVDFNWHEDVHDISESDIKNLGENNIARCDIMAPCKDFALSRLLPSKYGGKLSNPRPGLTGKHGLVFLQCMLIATWVLEYNSQCELFVENVLFEDLKDDWQLVCRQFGQPLLLDAADFSTNRRVRAYWTRNMPLPSYEVLTSGFEPTEANQYMDEGRTIEPYLIDGKQTIRTIGASWRGDPYNPVADTAVPVVVHDVQSPGDKNLRVHEAELLLGFPVNSTAGRGVTPKDRLSGLGDSWDMRVAIMINRFSKHATKKVDSALEVMSSRQLLNERQMRRTMMAARAEGGPDAVIQLLSQLSLDEQMAVLDVLRKSTSPVMFAGSVVDSGSSKHLHSRVQVMHQEDVASLTGFDSSGKEVTWTEGNGYVPLRLRDEMSGEMIDLDIDDADKLSTVALNLLSMGKLLRKKFSFYLESEDNLYLMSPSKQQKFKMELGDDDILRLPHEMRTGKSAAPLPKARVLHVAEADKVVLHARRVPEEQNALLLHGIFNHRSMEKVYQTLKNTRGYEAVRLPDVYCWVCARAKAQRRGLHSNLVVNLPGDVYEDFILLCCMAGLAPDDTFDDDNHDDSSEDGDDSFRLEIEYISPATGRSMGIQPVPRFNLNEIQPFEVMFCDNKDYEQSVRGGWTAAFVLIDLKSTAKFKVDITRKSENGLAFRRLMALNGVHKMPYHCLIYSDGCGSMVHVEIAAVMMGLNHAFIPPHEQSLNEAEKVCLTTWDDAAALMMESKAPAKLFAEAVSMAMYTDLRMSTTASRQYKTPIEIISGLKPDISKLHRFFTLAFVCVPKQKRKQRAIKGHFGRAEPGRLVGFQGPFSSTYRVLLPNNHIAHSINVTFDDTNCSAELQTPKPGEVTQPGLVPIGDGRASMEVAQAPHEERGAANASPLALDHYSRSQVRSPSQDHQSQSAAASQIPRSPPVYGEGGHDYFDLDHPDNQQFFYNDTAPASRPRPSYVFLVSLEKAHREKEMYRAEAIMAVFETAKEGKKVDHGAYRDGAMFLAMLAQKDMSWKKALASDDSPAVIESFHKERDSLLSTVLRLVERDDPRYEEKRKAAITGRYLLDIKRSGEYKTRGVKHGFKENKDTADGPGFNYYSNVAKLYNIRISFFRVDRGTRAVGLLDESVAFLQSDKFPDWLEKFLLMWNPIELEFELFDQEGPLYGENSAPKRWEDTYAPYLESEEFSRGHNDQSIFYNEEHDVLNLTYVDDNYLDAETSDIHWAAETITDRFDCKDLIIIPTTGVPEDHLGMLLSMDSDRTYLEMHSYIDNCLQLLEWTDLKPASRPMRQPVDTDSQRLDPEQAAKFQTGLGMAGWLQITGRPDIALACSRLGQHQANPTVSALDGLEYLWRYLKGAKYWCLSGPMFSSDREVRTKPLFDNTAAANDQMGWKFYVDTDFAGNAEPQNKRRSQIGILATLNSVPVYWKSTVYSECFASADIGVAHAERSSGAAEVIGVGNATQDILHLSYVCREMNIPFPKPFILQMDNSAAQVFAEGGCRRTKMKHIDCAQEWVKILRDRDIMTPVHVDTKENLADIFTKILEVGIFIYLRSKLMYERKPQ